jgi:PAS domain S-box-containing protein
MIQEKKYWWSILLGLLLLLGLWATTLQSYLIFHGLAEICSIVIAFTIFVLVWNLKQYISNNYIVFIGIAYLFVAGIDFIHILAYKGMGVFQLDELNLATQLWIAGRYLQSISLVGAALFIARKLRANILLIVYLAITCVLLISIFAWDIFPVCFIEGTGQTNFKIVSEYIISGILVLALVLLIIKRHIFEKNIIKFLVASIVITIFSELSFTLYKDVYGIANFLGHIFKIIAFYFIYRAIVEIGIRQPFSLFLREQKLEEKRKLEESEAKLRAFIDGSDDAIAIRDRERRLIMWNPAFARSIKINCGVDVQVGMRVEDYVAKEVLAKFKTQRDHLSLVFAGEPQRAEFEFPCPDGNILYFDTHWAPIRKGDEVVAVAEITRDMTEQKRQAEDIKIYHERLENFVKRAPIIIYFIKLDDPMPLDGSLSLEKQIDYLYKHAYIEDANDFWAKAIGYNQGKDLIGFRLNDFLPRENPDNMQMLKRYIQAKYRNDSFESMEKYPSGVTKYFINNMNSIIENNKLIGIWGTSVNITELKLAEKKLIEAESKYRTVAEFTYDWEYWESTTGELLYVSPSCKRITGYTNDEFIANPRLLEDIIVPEYKNIWAKHRREAQGKSKFLEIQFLIRKKDGSIRWIEHVCQSVKDDDGKFLGFRASNRDVTLRKEAEEAIQKSQDSLRFLAGKLLTAQEEERRLLAREMHDDFTQRLALLAIKAGKLEIDIKEQNNPMSAQVQTMKEEIIKLSKDIHDISRQIHPAILDDLGLVKAIKSECDTFTQREGINVEYETENIPSSIPRNVKICIYRIMQESLRNIAKHADADKAYVSLICSDGNLFLTIRDNGIGFDTSHIPDQKGIGLKSIDERVRLIQGEFSVQSKPGEGTVIKVTAPCAKEQE